MKRTDFIRQSSNEKFVHDLLKIIKYNWSEIKENTSLLSVHEFTDKQLKTLACMHLELFTKKSFEVSKFFYVKEEGENRIRFVFHFIIEDIRIDLESLLPELNIEPF